MLTQRNILDHNKCVGNRLVQQIEADNFQVKQYIVCEKCFKNIQNENIVYCDSCGRTDSRKKRLIGTRVILLLLTICMDHVVPYNTQRDTSAQSVHIKHVKQGNVCAVCTMFQALCIATQTMISHYMLFIHCYIMLL